MKRVLKVDFKMENSELNQQKVLEIDCELRKRKKSQLKEYRKLTVN